ncbi:MAG TPA: DUF2892 domain-containing protein [Steroidobacteraceae bacterium]|nr:DUF2892 domain-containing protein [Steroidobacteraceae bacterium]
MSIDRIVLVFTGSMVVLGLALGRFVSPYWLILSGVMGVNLVQAAFTSVCPLAYVLRKAGFQSSAVFSA